MTKLHLRLVSDTPKRAIGTSVPFVAGAKYNFQHKDLFFAREHDRSKGFLEKTVMPLSRLQMAARICGIVAVVAVIVAALFSV